MAVSITPQYARRYLVAAGNDEIWSEDVAGTLTQITDLTVDTSDQLEMFQGYQKCFIVNGTNLKVADFINDKLTYSSGLTTPPLKGDTLTQATSGAAMLVDFVSADKKTIYGYRTTTATFNTSNNITSDDAGGQTMDPASWTPTTENDRTEGPFGYDWVKHPSKTTSLPSKAYLGCMYRGRCVLSGNPEAPHQWYMSRQGDPFDFDYDSTDAQSAVAGNNANAGVIGDIVRSLIPFGDDFLVFGCASSMWLLRGDPVFGGELDERSNTVGIYGPKSWCKDDGGNLYFWGSHGIYRMANTGSTLALPENLSEVTLPKLIEDEAADPSTHRITMGFDKRRQGIFISVTKLSDGTNSCYWFDNKLQGFYPESYNAVNGIYSQFYYDANDTDYADLLIGCTDGFVRHFSDSNKDDNIGGTTQAINSYMVMPLTQISNDEDRNGVINSMTIITSGGESGGSESDTDALSWEVHVGNDAETAYERLKDGETAQESGSVTGTGRHERIRKRIRANWLALKIFNSTASQSWSLEKILAVWNSKGRIR